MTDSIYTSVLLLMNRCWQLKSSKLYALVTNSEILSKVAGKLRVQKQYIN